MKKNNSPYRAAKNLWHSLEEIKVTSFPKEHGIKVRAALNIYNSRQPKLQRKNIKSKVIGGKLFVYGPGAELPTDVAYKEAAHIYHSTEVGVVVYIPYNKKGLQIRSSLYNIQAANTGERFFKTHKTKDGKIKIMRII